MSTDQVVPAGRRRARVGLGRWALAAALCLVLAGGGAMLGYMRTPVYTAETRLAVGPESFAAMSVPGFVSASKELASNYARYVVDTNAGVDDLEKASNLPQGSLTSLSASPIPDSNIVIIEVESPSQSDALKAVAAAAQNLIDQVNSPPAESDAVLAALQDASQKVADQQQVVDKLRSDLDAAISGGDGVQIAAARGALARAQAVLMVDQVQQKARADVYTGQYQDGVMSVTLSVVRAATVTRDSRRAAVEWGVLVGLLVGAGISASFVRPPRGSRPSYSGGRR